MKKFTVVITEVLEREVTVCTESAEDAKYVVEKQYYSQEHILDESDLKEQSFKVKT